MENEPQQKEEIILLILDFLKSINFTTSLNSLRIQAEQEFNRRFDENTYRTIPRGLLLDSVRFVANTSNNSAPSSMFSVSGLINRAYTIISLE